jgi:hypothetical protein
MHERVVRGEYQGHYEEDPTSGEFLPRGYREPLVRFFTLKPAGD